MSGRFGEENPFKVLCNKVGWDHFDGILYDVFFNTRMIMEWHLLQEKERQCVIPYTEKEIWLCRYSYESICALYGHVVTGTEDMTYMQKYLHEFFELYDKWEGVKEYLRFKKDRWHRTEFPDGIIIDKSIW